MYTHSCTQSDSLHSTLLTHKWDENYFQDEKHFSSWDPHFVSHRTFQKYVTLEIYVISTPAMPAEVGTLKEMFSSISLIIKVMQMEKHIPSFETLLRSSCNHQIQKVRMVFKCQKLDSILAQSQLWSTVELLCISTGTWFYSQSAQSSWELAQVETWSRGDDLSVGASSRFHCTPPAQELLKQNMLTQSSAGKTDSAAHPMMSLSVPVGGSLCPAAQMPSSLSLEQGAAAASKRFTSDQDKPRDLSLTKINQEAHFCCSAACHYLSIFNMWRISCINSAGTLQEVFSTCAGRHPPKSRRSVPA